MKVAFFIGHHKTGSTALQTYLAKNYLALARQGILYPASDSQAMAGNLAVAIAGRDLAEEDPKRALPLSQQIPHNLLALRILNEAIGTGVPPWHSNVTSSEAMFQNIENQIAALSPHTVLMCSEIFSRFADKGWDKTLPLMQKNFGAYDCSIVLNLRRPDLHIASWHLQRMKFREKVKPLRAGAHAAYLNNAHFRFDRIVERWAEAFPQAPFHVRNSTDVMAAGGSVPDFFAQSGIDYVPVDSGERSNPSLPYAFAEIMRQANAKIPGNAKKLRSYLFQAVGRVTYLPNDQVELFGQANRTALCDAFAPVHAALSTRLGVEAFFPDMDQARICHPVPELDAAQQALDLLRADAKDALKRGAVRDFLQRLTLKT